MSELLSRLDGVQKSAPGRYRARCPAHEGKGKSLGVTELSDGRTLIRCFAGCETLDVLTAVGLTFSDLYPPVDKNYPRERAPFNPRDVLRCISTEATVVALAAAWLAKGRPLDDMDQARLQTALERISEAAALAKC